MKKLSILFALLFFTQILNAQLLKTDYCGASLGLSIQFGSTVNRIGLFAKGFGIYRDFQLNADLRWHFNISSFGPPRSGQEMSYKLGIVWAWGNSDTLDNPFLSPVSNQIGKKNSLGYSFNQYWDQIGTSQKTGLISLQLNRLNFIIENDAFAGPPADKFRTAAMILNYRLTETSTIGINSILWTGDPFTNLIDTETQDPDYPSQYGYRDMSNANYGECSHGIISAQFQQLFPNHQQVKMELGADSEYIRHLLQNIIIHDLYFVPRSLNPSKHPHIPMVADDGSQYLFLPHQKVKPSTFFGQFAVNGTWFY